MCENGERKSYRFFISHHARRALRCLRALSVYKQYTCTARSNRCDLGRDFSACVGTRVKNSRDSNRALFSACVDTRKNSRDLNRDSNRAFLVCGNAPIISDLMICQSLAFFCQNRAEFSRNLVEHGCLALFG